MIPEYQRLDFLAHTYSDIISLRKLTHVSSPKFGQADMFLMEFCSAKNRTRTDLPTFFLTAGVHGIEAIGVRLVLSFIEHLVAQLSWNKEVQALFDHVRLAIIPIVNPIGYLGCTRSNGNGVDIMRNAPVESSKAAFLVGGQRFSPRLPFFRGENQLEIETETLLECVQEYTKKSGFMVSLDVHSGFGFQDYLWTPFAKDLEKPKDWVSFLKIKETLDHTHPHHVYKFQKQAESYMTHGDVWDYLYTELREKNNKSPLFLPLTLEVGSWKWVKKAPYTLFKLRNIFNPAHLHRQNRALRRHLTLLNFLLTLARNHDTIFNSKS